MGLQSCHDTLWRHYWDTLGKGAAVLNKLEVEELAKREAALKEELAEEAALKEEQAKEAVLDKFVMVVGRIVVFE